MKRDLFGTDGVRGIAGEYPLDVDGAYRIGMAVGTHFAQPGQQIVIGWDPRESSQQIVDDLSRGLVASGVTVVKAGMLPTPGLAYVARENDDFVAGIMVTASHNPYQYNGVKVFDGDGDKLPDATEAVLNRLIDEGTPEREAGSTITDEQLITTYEDFLVASAEGMQFGGLKLAIDAANGAASGLAARVFTCLGAEVTALFDQPDGTNINDGCGATDTQVLQETVVREGLALGIALDGDSDRLIMADDQGREVKGDYILYILAVSRQLKGVVATVMSNLGFEQALQKQGIALERTAVGDRYVLEGLQRTGFKLGGEQSGHIILPNTLATGDALLAAIQTVCAVTQSEKTLATWCDEVELLPQALVNLPIKDRRSLDTPSVHQLIEAETSRLDGRGRLLIRPSGTEPLVRVMVEAPDAEQEAKEIAQRLQEVLQP